MDDWKVSARCVKLHTAYNRLEISEFRFQIVETVLTFSCQGDSLAQERHVAVGFGNEIGRA